jgi:exosortase/archaeosortase family protein
LDISFYPLQTVFTNFLASILSFLGYQIKTLDYFLFIGETEFPIDISRDCIGWKGMYSLFALVMATPTEMKGKLKFLIIGLPFMFLVNIIRVIGTMLIGLNFGLHYIDFIHTFLWQQLMILILLGTWYLWLKKGNINIEKMRNIL